MFKLKKLIYPTLSTGNCYRRDPKFSNKVTNRENQSKILLSFHLVVSAGLFFNKYLSLLSSRLKALLYLCVCVSFVKYPKDKDFNNTFSFLFGL